MPFAPPPKREQLTIDAAEITALRVIVMSLVATVAKVQELEGGVQAQLWVNGLAEVAADAAASIETKDNYGQSVDGFKDRVLENVMSILSGIKFPKVEGGN